MLCSREEGVTSSLLDTGGGAKPYKQTEGIQLGGGRLWRRQVSLMEKSPEQGTYKGKGAEVKPRRGEGSVV